MRILALTNLYPNPFQPHRATFNRQQLRALAERHHVTVISPIAWTDELSARRKGAVPLPRARKVTIDGITVEHPRYLFPPKVLRGCYGHFFLRSVRPAFQRALAEFGPDVVFAPWAYPDGWAAIELGHRAGLPVAIKVHGSDILGLDAYPGRRRRTAEALGRADAVVAVSRDLATRVVELGADPSRVRVVSDGVDRDLFHEGPRDEARRCLGLDGGPIALFIGNLTPVKGIDILLDSCTRLVHEGLRFRCLLIGQGPLRSALQRHVSRSGLGDTVELLGPRPHDQLPDWFRAATVFVLPSRSEGVPIVLLEALACGTPFVASRVGGVPEISHLGPSRLVPPEDAGALAGALREGLSGALGTGGGAAIRSHAEVASELTDLFEKLIKAGVRQGPRTAAGPPVATPSLSNRPPAAEAAG